MISIIIIPVLCLLLASLLTFGSKDPKILERRITLEDGKVLKRYYVIWKRRTILGIFDYEDGVHFKDLKEAKDFIKNVSGPSAGAITKSVVIKDGRKVDIVISQDPSDPDEGLFIYYSRYGFNFTSLERLIDLGKKESSVEK